MSIKVKLSDILEGMEMQSLDNMALLNTKTGNVVHLMREFLTQAEDIESFDHLPEWQQEQMTLAIDVLDKEESYMDLPSDYEIHEYEIMESFCYTINDSKAQNNLLLAINGKGAFRRFKDKAISLNVIEDWYTYRDECYKQIAIDFCDRNGFDWV